jgi:NAD(P)-dependent dehydrogenase (short-subunit alcohol dehydrogenase family)
MAPVEPQSQQGCPIMNAPLIRNGSNASANPHRFTGRHVVVSGGAAGVGAEACRLFAAEGALLSIIDIQTSLAEALAEQLMEQGAEAMAIAADISDEAAVERAIRIAVDRFGPVDILFNHAGTLVVKPFHETSLEEWRRLFAVNVESMFLMSRAVIPSMIARGGGVIVNTSSISANLATPMEVLYCASKAACTMITKGIATEYRDQFIRCNAVCPGFIRTAHGLREIDILKSYGVDVTETGIAELQGRICEPIEVARAALFLASNDASFINGETLFVDNGMMVRT